MVTYSKYLSPVGWYVGSYLLRFIELNAMGNNDPDGRFLAWENTVIVQASDFDEAYRKVQAIASQEATPYEGGPDAVPVQWVFEGITELLPIYEPLQDGSEIMWTEHESLKLSDLKKRARSLDQLRGNISAKEA
ncbi:DUF4288 domain-containing protein [Dyella silvatica]|uniref:DUF4288 domain-containing protein n=1 Tax=Dyella silvatica TaxID=2992128 RepID=UPI002257B23B|nr:DUF4288 domain-containing protein [Dyella silvatica]